MIDLIADEIRRLSGSKGKPFPEDHYAIHCSLVFMEHFHKAIQAKMDKSIVVQVPKDTPEQEKVKFTQLHIPDLGKITFQVDREQGYEIVKA